MVCGREARCGGETMNRRSFVGLLAATLPAALIVPELWVPKRTFFLPPAGGWAHPSLTEWRHYAHMPHKFMNVTSKYLGAWQTPTSFKISDLRTDDALITFFDVDGNKLHSERRKYEGPR